MSKIRTYDDLLQEEQRLQQHLKAQEAVIRLDLAGFRSNLQPIRKAYDNVSKVFTRDNTSPFMNFGLEFGIDLFIRRVLLARAGWFTKIVIPYLVKNYSSHIIGEEKRKKLFQKVQGIFARFRGKPEQAAPATGV
jgi:hypothetical protein